MNWKKIGLIASLASIVGSIGIYFGLGDENLGIFVGLWASALLLLTDRVVDVVETPIENSWNWVTIIRWLSLATIMALINFETYMVFVAFASLASWLPQLYRINQTKSTDDFSLITTGILLWANVSFLVWGLHNFDIPLMVQQSLTVFMLFVFTYMVLKYRTTLSWLTPSK